MNYCGIDLANESSAICVVNGEGKVLRQCFVKTEASGFQSALQGLAPLRCVVEASALSESVCRELASVGAEAHIIDPRRAKRLAESRKKTDRRDAKTLADLCRSGFYQVVYAKDAETRALRTQLKARDGLRAMTTQLNAQIRGLLRANGIRVGKVDGGGFAGAVDKALESASEPVAEVIAALLDLWQETQRRKLAVQQLIKRHEMARDAVSERLYSVPQVSTLTALAYRTALVDPHRFANGRAVADYFGLAPGIYQSGSTLQLGRITREGDGLARKQLVGAAARLLNNGPDCALRRFGLRVMARRGRSKAQVAVARKLAILLWNLWRRDEDFDLARA